jgi:hypothetical protein
VYYNTALKHIRLTIVAVEKQYRILNVSVASVIQQAKHMRSILLSSVTCLAITYFSSHYLKTARFSGEKFMEHEMCDLIFSNFCLKLS